VPVAAVQDPPTPLLSTRLGSDRSGLVAEAIRQMARDLERHERARRSGREAAVRRAFAKLAAGRDEAPTARELAQAAGVSVEDVLEERLAD
jgi:DNA-directed RNA polymerase specialized sigma subunit